MNKTIYVEVRDWYGRRTFTPRCEESERFARLLRQKTLTPDNIEDIKALGYVIETKGKKL